MVLNVSKCWFPISDITQISGFTISHIFFKSPNSAAPASSIRISVEVLTDSFITLHIPSSVLYDFGVLTVI
jgi:hypothetical protein